MNHLLDYLDEPLTTGSDPNPTTLLRQGQVAQEWLLQTYLDTWLVLIGGLVECGYPLAQGFRPALRAIARMTEQLDCDLPAAQQLFRLHNIETHLRSTIKRMCADVAHRDLQWGIWSRDVPSAIAYGFDEVDFLDPLVCRAIAQCTMYAAFLVSQVVTDEGVAEEIEAEMFGVMPRRLIELLSATPSAPEA